MIRTILFDMGNVLVYFSHERMYSQIGEVCGLSGPRMNEVVLEQGLLRDFESGRISNWDMHRRLEQLASRQIRLDDLARASCDIFELNEPMAPLLDELKAGGCRLVLFSNTSAAHFDWVSRKFDILNRFDDFVLSYQVGALKPEPEMFEAALSKIDCRPDECFYTDDMPENIAAGRTHGLQAEVFEGAAGLRASLTGHGICRAA